MPKTAQSFFDQFCLTAFLGCIPNVFSHRFFLSQICCSLDIPAYELPQPSNFCRKNSFLILLSHCPTIRVGISFQWVSLVFFRLIFDGAILCMCLHILVHIKQTRMDLGTILANDHLCNDWVQSAHASAIIMHLLKCTQMSVFELYTVHAYQGITIKALTVGIVALLDWSCQHHFKNAQRTPACLCACIYVCVCPPICKYVFCLPLCMCSYRRGRQWA